MKKESPTTQTAHADAIADSGVRAVVYTADRGNYTADRGDDELTARAACLNALIQDAAQMGAHRLPLERDDSLIRWTTSGSSSSPDATAAAAP
jgi:hypothetical protein